MEVEEAGSAMFSERGDVGPTYASGCLPEHNSILVKFLIMYQGG